MSETREASEYVPELEEQALGCLLLGDGFGRVQGFLRPDHFLNPDYRVIFEAIGLAHERYGKTSAGLVAKLIDAERGKTIELRSHIRLPELLGRLVAASPYTAAGVERAAKNVVEQFARIRMADELERASLAARDPAADFAAIMRHVGATLDAIGSDARNAGRRRASVSIGEAARAAVEAAKSVAAAGNGLSGIPWGPLSDLDRITGGMQRKDLLLIGARPSMGKTSIALSVALGAARKGHGVGFLSLEMSAARLTDRALSDLSLSTSLPIPYSDIITGRLDEAKLVHLAQMGDRLDRYPIEINDSAASTFDIRSRIESMMERFRVMGWPRLDLVMIDHLGFIRPGSHYAGNRNNEIGEITRTLKDYAKEYDLPIVLLTQLNRQLASREDKRPQLSDLRDSGNIEQDADFVALLHREAYYLERSRSSDPDADIEREERLERTRHQLEFIIAKSRNDRVQTVDLWCDMAFSAVRNGERYRS